MAFHCPTASPIAIYFLFPFFTIHGPSSMAHGSWQQSMAFHYPTASAITIYFFSPRLRSTAIVCGP
jgi:hypothetical protein